MTPADYRFVETIMAVVMGAAAICWLVVALVCGYGLLVRHDVELLLLPTALALGFGIIVSFAAFVCWKDRTKL